ncbi:Hypothetical protein (Fragment) [Durusdinium trenchii]|uniref:Ricin B lectin domain-containing protein n=1 Tax=Durusdinium trenchii TaxID=1381693 RepID=A0ABP0HAK6_9DINO
MPVIYLAALVGFMAVAVYVLMLPSLEARETTWEGLCGGNKNFAVATDGLGRLHWSITNPFTELDESDSDTYVHRATESLIRNLDVNPYSPMTIYDPSFDHLRNVVQEQTVIEAGASRNCADADSDAGPDYWSNMGVGILRMACHNDQINQCADVKPYCRNVSLGGLRSRQWCPETCGCSDILSGLLLDRVQNGCPATCVQKLRGDANTVQCADAPLNFTQVYARGAQILFTQKGYNSPQLAALAKKMETQGCPAIAHGDVAGKDLCVGNSVLLTTIYFRSVKYVCPVACGCDGSGLPGQKRDLATVSSVESGFRLSGDLVASRLGWLNDTKFAPHGNSGNGAPVFLSEEGAVYLYHGPCEAGGSGIRWFLSPTLCNPGYYMAYITSQDPTRPPQNGDWFMDCRSAGWKRPALLFSPIIQAAVPGNIFDRVNKTIQLTSDLCEARENLVNDVFQLQGETENGAPLFRSLKGNYLYHGPRCGIGHTGKRWIISPLLCSGGFSLAFYETEDGQAPPLDDVWNVNCGRLGWKRMALDFNVVPLIGRIRTDGGFCLQAWQMRALLQPCNTDEAQLWIYNETSGQLKDRNGYCLEATAVPMLGQAIGTPVNVGLCDVALSIQQWECLVSQGRSG